MHIKDQPKDGRTSGYDVGIAEKICERLVNGESLRAMIALTELVRTPTVLDQYSPFPRLQQAAGRLRISLVVARKTAAGVIVPPSIAATVVLKCALLSFKPTIGARI
jgi:hypothetical protein